VGERAALIKFGSCEHVSQLRDDGLLYMNNLPYFWKIEDSRLRGDECDGVDARHTGNSGTVKTLDGKTIATVTNWTANLPPSKPEKINLFCMYALRQSSLPVDKRNYRFGDHTVVVTHAQEFIDRVASHLKHQRIAFKANLVEYVDDNQNGQLGPFKKRRMFAHQSEWRVGCYDGPGGVRKITIGSIQDISFIIPSNELNAWADQVGFAKSE